jgi:hypothetical protein
MPRKAMATFKRLVAPIAGNTSNHDNKVYDICRGVAKERGVIDFQVCHQDDHVWHQRSYLGWSLGAAV